MQFNGCYDSTLCGFCIRVCACVITLFYRSLTNCWVGPVLAGWGGEGWLSFLFSPDQAKADTQQDPMPATSASGSANTATLTRPRIWTPFASRAPSGGQSESESPLCCSVFDFIPGPVRLWGFRCVWGRDSLLLTTYSCTSCLSLGSGSTYTGTPVVPNIW